MQRVRVQYAKRGAARFTSSRDVSRALERSLRRASVPMAYSSGFSPHPRISYANSSPTSAATEAEFLELGLSAQCDLDKLAAALDGALPKGLDVVAVAASDSRSWGELLQASTWLIDLGAVDGDQLSTAVEAFLRADQSIVRRMTKSGVREFDARAATHRLRHPAGDDEGSIEVVLAHTTPLVRPEDVVAALRELQPDLNTGKPALTTRLNQGVWTDGVMVNPLTNQPWP